MSMRTVNGDVVLPSSARGAGTYTAGPLVYGPGVADLLVLTHISAVSGTSPTLVVSVEQSADGSSWSAVTGAASATLSAVGNSMINASVTQPYVRVSAVVAGTTPSFTFRVAVLVFGE